MLPPWPDCEPLRAGSPRQRAAYAVLRALEVMPRLAAFRPVLAGTLPLPIHTDASDLDILCEVDDPAGFVRAAAAAFGAAEGFEARSFDTRGVPSTLVAFSAGGFDLELFGQPGPVARQHAYRHLRVEARVLALAGPEAADTLRTWKLAGLKTEPAFARYLGLPGDDPYLALLALEDASDAELRALLARA